MQIPLHYPHVAVVILCWNGRKFLEQFVPPLLKTTYPNVSYYVADNASTDDSLDYLRQHFPWVEIIAIDENQGFSTGYNIALKQVQADYYVLLNQDVEVAPGWIEPVIAAMQQGKHIGAAQPKLRAYDSKTDFEYAGAAGGYTDSLGYMFCRGRIFDAVEPDTGQYDTPAEIFWASGAAMFVRAQLYHQIGGLDDTFFAHMEEIDLCWRIKSAGYSIVYCPDSVVYHVGGGSLPQGNPRKTYLNFRNNLFLLYKNLPAYQLWYKMPVRLALDCLAAFKSLAGGNSNDFWAIGRAHRHFFRALPSLRKRRKENWQLIRGASVAGPNRNGSYKGLIIWDFFFRKKTKFSQLDSSKFIGAKQ
ncbi:MAG: glycosyltransferase family 2 protein [Chitinophagales bacterium]|nr:glycosyltransferase family 2 protein [Chitinophagales bacterium]